jgi:hypothetical protein
VLTIRTIKQIRRPAAVRSFRSCHLPNGPAQGSQDRARIADLLHKLEGTEVRRQWLNKLWFGRSPNGSCRRSS